MRDPFPPAEGAGPRGPPAQGTRLPSNVEGGWSPTGPLRLDGPRPPLSRALSQPRSLFLWGAKAFLWFLLQASHARCKGKRVP